MKNERDFLSGHKDDQFESFDLGKEPISPQKFMPVRASHYKKDFFFPHPIYDTIKTKIIETDLIFIVGDPLAGKTRIVFDTLSNLKDGFIVKPKLDKTIKEYRLPRRNDLIVFFDELDDYCRTNAEAMNKVLTYIITKKIKCIATCRTGPEFNQVRKNLHPHIYSALSSNQITIHKFDKDEPMLKQFLSSNSSQIKNIKSFDGNMGALILPLEDMAERFTNLVEKDKRWQIAILKGLKIHYHLYNYESKKSFYDDSKILNFCKKHLQEEITKYEWENAKRELNTDDTTLNFIDEKEFIIIEEAYLDFLKNDNGDSVDVVDSTLNKYKIDRLLNDTYKDIIEKKTWGFPTDIRDYNKAIEKTETFEAAEVIFKALPKGIYPNEVTYSLLMNRTSDTKILERLYSELKSNGLKVKFVPQHSFLKGFELFGELLDSLIKLDKTSLLKRNSTTNKLIKLSENNPKESLSILFSKYTAIQIYGNPVFNQISLKCCRDDDDFKKYVQPFIEEIGVLDYPLIKNFIRICSNLNQKEITLNLIEKYLKDNSYDYFNEKGNCIKDDNPKEALILFSEAANHYTNLVELVNSYSNYANLVYDKEIITELETTINRTNQFFQKWLPQLKDITNTHYLKEALILLTIWKLEIDKINMDYLLQIPFASRSIYLKVSEKIKDEEKRKMIAELFNTTDKQAKDRTDMTIE